MGGVRAIGRRMIGLASSVIVVGALGLSVPARGAAAVDCSQGRTLLQCNEKLAIYNDSFNWGIGGFLDLTMFAAHLPLHLSNGALREFWHYETATGITRYEFELASIEQNVDQNFEQVAPPATLPSPPVKATGIVTRRMAGAMRALLIAEQQEVANLVAMETALSRATAALKLGRRDWAGWQTYAAAGFARGAAQAIGRVIPAQQRVTKTLVRARLLFGVGAADERVAQRWVRRHGFPAPVQQIMSKLGASPVVLALARSTFVNSRTVPVTYSLARYLSSARVVGDEKKCMDALQAFAARIPLAPHPA